MSASRKASVVLSVVGILLILAAVLTYAVVGIQRSRGEETREELLSELSELTPETKDVVPDGRGISAMSSVRINGFDLVGSISVPSYSRELPVGSTWMPSELKNMPHRYTGSVHDGSLIIGGSAHNGQFDFMKQISIGDTVFFTDVDGGRYSYSVSDIKITKEMSVDYLSTFECDLILFARNVYSFDYTVVICSYR